MSVERRELDADQGHDRYNKAPYSGPEIFDAQNVLARSVMQIPAPRLHQIAYCGAYSVWARAARGRPRPRSQPATASAAG